MKAKLTTIQQMANVIEKTAGYKEAERFVKRHVKKVKKSKQVKK